MRLAKYLASCGLGSRRSCEKLVSGGHVTVNGIKTITVTTEVQQGKDIVKVDDKIVRPKPLVYYLLNKPLGYTTSRRDPHASHLITDLLPKEPPIWPVGRLDKNTAGLIVLTNNGDLTQKLTHPKYQKEKEYIIETDIKLSDSNIKQIQHGVFLADGFIKPDSFVNIDNKQYRIILHEGRNRIIRRLINHFDRKVISLKRVRLGNIKIGDLKPGKYRKLTNKEITELENNV